MDFTAGSDHNATGSRGAAMSQPRTVAIFCHSPVSPPRTMSSGAGACSAASRLTAQTAANALRQLLNVFRLLQSRKGEYVPVVLLEFLLQRLGQIDQLRRISEGLLVLRLENLFLLRFAVGQLDIAVGRGFRLLGKRHRRRQADNKKQEPQQAFHGRKTCCYDTAARRGSGSNYFDPNRRASPVETRRLLMAFPLRPSGRSMIYSSSPSRNASILVKRTSSPPPIPQLKIVSVTLSYAGAPLTAEVVPP